MSRYQEFQKKQVQCLLELREAQADTEAERRLEHLQQVRGGRRVAGGAGRACAGTDLSAQGHLLATCVCRLS